MIFLFYGSDTEKVRTKAFEWIAKARTKEPNLAYTRLSREELTSAVLEDASHSGGLFVKRVLVLVDDPFQEEGSSDVLDDYLDQLVASDNAIVILAPRLVATKAKKISAKAKIEYKYDKAIPKEAGGFNSNLVNALGSRSREKLWLEVNRALIAGDAPEMLHGLLHWKARDMRNRQLSLQLIELLQSSRRGGLDLGRALERFALSL